MEIVEDLARRKIYDRWGSLVFQQNDLLPNDASKGWDGLVGKKKAAPGVYIWQGMVELSDGEMDVRNGDVTVVR